VAKGITRELLIRTALEIVDADGLGALSMRRLGAELGVDPMTAYRHLPNKEALLDGVMEAVVSEIDLDVDGSLPWQDQLRQLIGADMRAMLAHPNVLPVLARRPLTTPGSLRLVERAFQIMADAGVPLRDAALATNAIGMITSSLALAISESSMKDPRPTAEQTVALFASLPREEFPRIVETVETGQFIESYDAILEFAVGAFLYRLERAREAACDCSE
jgi:AcrR family transcriptional regulator